MAYNFQTEVTVATTIPEELVAERLSSFSTTEEESWWPQI
jgi:hypothetical protein